MPEIERTRSQKILRNPFTFFLMFVGLVYLAFQHLSPVVIAVGAVAAFGWGQLTFVGMRQSQAERRAVQNRLEEVNQETSRLTQALQLFCTFTAENAIAEIEAAESSETPLSATTRICHHLGRQWDTMIEKFGWGLAEYRIVSAQELREKVDAMKVNLAKHEMLQREVSALARPDLNVQ